MKAQANRFKVLCEYKPISKLGRLRNLAFQRRCFLDLIAQSVDALSRMEVTEAWRQGAMDKIHHATGFFLQIWASFSANSTPCLYFKMIYAREADGVISAGRRNWGWVKTSDPDGRLELKISTFNYRAGTGLEVKA